MAARKVTKSDMAAVRKAVAEVFGEEESRFSVVMGWDWPSTPTPTLILEGLYGSCGDGWACAPEIEKIRPLLVERGLAMEPYAGYALCVYTAEAFGG